MTTHTATPRTANSADDFEMDDRVRVHVDDYEYGWAEHYRDAGRDWIVGHIDSHGLDADGDFCIRLEDPPDCDEMLGPCAYAKPEDLEHC